MSLLDVPEGSFCRMGGVPYSGMLARRLGELGLFCGARVRIVRNRAGPVILEVFGSRLAMGRRLAGAIGAGHD